MKLCNPLTELLADPACGQGGRGEGEEEVEAAADAVHVEHLPEDEEIRVLAGGEILVHLREVDAAVRNLRRVHGIGVGDVEGELLNREGMPVVQGRQFRVQESRDGVIPAEICLHVKGLIPVGEVDFQAAILRGAKPPVIGRQVHDDNAREAVILEGNLAGFLIYQLLALVQGDDGFRAAAGQRLGIILQDKTRQ